MEGVGGGGGRVENHGERTFYPTLSYYSFAKFLSILGYEIIKKNYHLDNKHFVVLHNEFQFIFDQLL